MTQVPQESLVPNNTLITATPQYAHDPYGLIAASHVVAVEFATVAAANNYWR